MPFINTNKKVLKDIGIGLLVVIVVGVLFNKLGISKVANVSSKGAGVGVVALMVGLTAGFSTCMAMIGGLVLSVSSRHAEKHPTATPIQKFRPHLFFNLGRILSFTVLGGVIGVIGAAFQLRGSLLGLMTIAVGLVMLLLGLQLTELFPRLKGAITLPSSVGQLIGIKKYGEREYSHMDAFFMGAVTFFLPCGFTQAMQLLAVSTGSPLQGALIMGAFAAGTAPGLLSIGGLTSVVRGLFAQRFFRIVGVAVVAMALINFTNGYNLMGLGRLFDHHVSTPSSGQAVTSSAGASQADSAASADGATLHTTFRLNPDISPSSFIAKVGQKTTLVVDVQENGQGCMSTIMIPGLDDTPQYLKAGKKITLTFTPTKDGTYPITCAMGVQRGSIKVEG
jgi:sulfite exporter TauE/SafE